MIYYKSYGGCFVTTLSTPSGGILLYSYPEVEDFKVHSLGIRLKLQL